MVGMNQWIPSTQKCLNFLPTVFVKGVVANVVTKTVQSIANATKSNV